LGKKGQGFDPVFIDNGRMIAAAIVVNQQDAGR
jgi:inosine/xanthosine triphosphate pyrophosphatase family protein